MNVLIVDNEPKPAKFISALLQTYCPDIKNKYIANKVRDALSMLQENTFDILFLDIEMPGMTGFDLLKTIPADQLPAIIFTTAYEEYAVRAFKVDAVDYLLKPIVPAELIKAVNKVKESLEKSTASIKSHNGHSRISIYDGNVYQIVNIDKLVRANADGSYTHFTLSDGTSLLSSKRLKIYEDLLKKFDFIRCHKSHLINPKFIKSMSLSDGGTLVLTNGETIPFSLSRKNLLLDYLKTP